MNPKSIKLLITLVLFILAATSAWMTSVADARGLSSPGASQGLAAASPGGGQVSGDPDSPQTSPTQPPPNPLKLSDNKRAGAPARGEWVAWTSRIWATLFLRTAR